MTTVTELQFSLAGRVTRNEEEGTAKLTREDFEKTLPEDTSMADILRAELATSRFRAAATGALGEASLSMLEGNPTRDYIDTEAEYGTQSKISNRVRRSHFVGKGDKRQEFHGHSTVIVSNGDEPELLAAIETIGRRGAELFGPK